MSNSIIVPHWVFIFLAFIAIFFDEENTYYSILYAVIFGLLIDVVYTGVLGVYMFSYAVCVYVFYGLMKMFHSNIYGSFLFCFTYFFFVVFIFFFIFFVCCV